MALTQQQWAVIQPQYAALVQQALEGTLRLLWQHLPETIDLPLPTTKAEWIETLHHPAFSDNLQHQLTPVWQHLLQEALPGEVLAELQAISTKRDALTCHQCGICCRLTSNEHDYKTLLAMAAAGDTFAEQFTRVMLPYDSTEAARKRFPALVASVEAQVANTFTATGQTTPLHFYHCPYVQEDNTCGLWNSPKRPTICATYPETPLVWMQPNCAWQPWQTAQLQTTLRCHATLVVCEQLLLTLQQAD